MNIRRSYIAIAASILALGPAIAFAWTSAPSSPPSSNIDAPINVGSTAQTKVAGLLISTNSGNANGLLVQYGNVGIGTTVPGYKLEVSGDVGATAFYYTSDRSLKENISTLSDSLQKILSLRGVSFNWKSDGSPSVGLIAQEVEKVYPELVSTNSSTGLKSVEYGNLVGPLIEAVKEQQREIEALKAEVEALKTR